MLKELLNLLVKNSEYEFRRGTFLRKNFSTDPAKELSAGKILKDSNSITAGINGSLFIKRYNRKGVWRALKRMIQIPRSYRCLAAVPRIRQAGVQTPDVKLASKYYLITDALPSDTLFLDRNTGLLEGFLPVMRKMHDAGVYHGDLSMRNIYFRNGEYGVIDLDSVRLFSGEIPPELRRKELARVISSYAKARKESPDKKRLSELAEQLAEIYWNMESSDEESRKLLCRTEYLFHRKRIPGDERSKEHGAGR